MGIADNAMVLSMFETLWTYTFCIHWTPNTLHTAQLLRNPRTNHGPYLGWASASGWFTGNGRCVRLLRLLFHRTRECHLCLAAGVAITEGQARMVEERKDIKAGVRVHPKPVRTL